MPELATFKGDYCDLRFVKSRQVCQIVIEIPIEQGAEFVARFGTPLPGKNVPVALARIDENAVKEKKGGKLCQRAAILCGEPAFWKFLDEKTTSGLGHNEDYSTHYLRGYCGVSSRRELDHNDEAGRKFFDLVAQYEVWKTL